MEDLVCVQYKMQSDFHPHTFQEGNKECSLLERQKQFFTYHSVIAKYLVEFKTLIS